MRTLARVVAISALLAFGSAACNNWLTGPGLTTPLNDPVSASRDQRLVSVEATMGVQLTGTLARAVCMWVQQCAGVQRQYSATEIYNTTSSDFDTEFETVYGGGGLLDIRFIETDAAAAGDSVYEGVGKVLEALDMSSTADLWGDVPYSQAVQAAQNLAPKFDSQLSVYTALLTVLSQAIVELGGPGAGPAATGVDLWYNGSKTKWTQLAHTLKARIYLHLVQRQGQAGVPCSACYANALAEANQGISTSANDLQTYQSATSTEWNLWYQFMVIQRSGYLAMGAQLVDSIMVKRNDPRLPLYFALDGNGRYQGAAPGDASDPTVQSSLAAARGGDVSGEGFQQPLVTHAEVQLIIAEAAYQTGDTVAGGTALASLNAERTAAGVDTVPPTVTGPALLDSIMIEKYVVMFQNMETWNDLKRECIPALVVPAAAVAAGATSIIARPFYGATEESANANAEPDPTSGRNWNDTNTNTCP